MRLERVINFQNILAGAVAIMTLPCGPTYEAIHLDLNGGLEIGDIDTIIGKIDNKPFYTTTGEKLLKQANYDGFDLPVDKVSIDFTMPDAKSMGSATGTTPQAGEILLTCLPSSLMQTLTFEFKLKADAPVGSAINALMQLAEPGANPFVQKQFETFQSLAGEGRHNILLPTGEAGGMMRQIFIYKESGAGEILDVELKNNGVTIMEATAEEIRYIQTKRFKKVQQTDLLVIDFHLQGMRSKLLNTVVGLNTFMKLNISGAMNLTFHSRFIDPINRK